LSSTIAHGINVGKLSMPEFVRIIFILDDDHLILSTTTFLLLQCDPLDRSSTFDQDLQ
jgi:hypothetical protein